MEFIVLFAPLLSLFENCHNKKQKRKKEGKQKEERKGREEKEREGRERGERGRKEGQTVVHSYNGVIFRDKKK